MIRELIATPIVLSIVVMLLTFGEMFIAKKWFTSFTVKMANPVARRGVNLIAGVATAVILAYAQIFAVCDWFNITLAVWTVFVAGLGATGMYLALEKVFGEAKVNELGKTMVNVLSHSKLFDGDLSVEGATKFTKKLLNVVDAIDKEVARQQDVAVDKAVNALEDFVKDGKITKEEQTKAEALLNNVNLDGHDVYKRYQALLNK